MAIWIFNKRGGKDKGKAPKGGLPVDSAPRVKKIVAQPEPVFHLDIDIDDAILAIDAELSGLARFDVAQAARERGWATLRRELQHRPVRVASAAHQKGLVRRVPIHSTTSRPVVAGHARGWRLALGSAVAAVAVMAVLLGTYGAGLLGTSDREVTAESVAVGSTDVTEPGTTVATDDITSSTDGSSTTDSTSATGNPSTTAGTTDSSTTHATGGSTPTGGSGTTQPKQTTTTNQQYASADKVETAEQAAQDLGDAILRDNISEALRLVAPGARSSLTQLVSSLNEPSAVKLVSTKTIAANTVRVTVEFSDLTYDGSTGQQVEAHPRFVITVVVDDNGATITAINAGS